MKALDLVRAALLVVAIVLLMRGIDRLRYPKYELVPSAKSNILASDSLEERLQARKSVPSVVMAVLQLIVGAVLISGIAWTIWRWDRSRLGLRQRELTR